jgi:MSHA biogenesis protein MshP
MTVRAKKQTGFSLVPALFLIIVLALLGAVAVRMGVVQSQTVVLAMQSSRAYQAARSGIEWAAFEAVVNGNCGNGSLNLSEGGLAGFRVSTTCAATTHTEGSNTVTVYRFEAFAQSGAFGQPDYVSRRIRTSLTDVS